MPPEKKETLVLFGLDADGCLFHHELLEEAIKHAKRKALERTAGNSEVYRVCDIDLLKEELIAHNQLAMEYFVEEADRVNADKMHFVSTSNRQSEARDFRNAYPGLSLKGSDQREDIRKCAGSFAEALPVIVKHVSELVPNKTVCLDTELWADELTPGRRPGDTFSEILKLVQEPTDSQERNDKILDLVMNGQDELPPDEYKEDLIVQRVRRASALNPNKILFYCTLEDRPEISDAMLRRFKDNPRRLPKNVTFKAYLYDGSGPPVLRGSIKGTGRIPSEPPEAAYMESPFDVDSWLKQHRDRISQAAPAGLPRADVPTAASNQPVSRGPVQGEHATPPQTAPRVARVAAPPTRVATPPQGNTEFEDILETVKRIVNSEEWNREGKGGFGNKCPRGIELMRRLFNESAGPSSKQILFQLASLAEGRKTGFLRGFWYRCSGIRSPRTQGLYDVVSSFVSENRLRTADEIRRLVDTYSRNHSEFGVTNNSPAEPSAGENTPSLRAGAR